MVREAIYQDLSAGERELHHERAARGLAAAGAEPEQGRARVLFELGSAEALTSGPDAIEHLREARVGLEDEASRAVAASILTRNLMIAGSPSAALLEEELELARAYGAPGTLGRVLRELGTAEREDGLARLEEAVSVLEGSSARLELAKALAAHGAALRLARRPKEAREPLRRALELAEACRAAPLQSHVRSELQAAGVRPRTSALSGVEALTASERRVADLAAGGGTNRDIAQELFVTPKTVEVHLSNTYRKLGISSRRQLPEVLATVG
ncbi:MAG: helix-turn-helix transcriptional regulator [Thermoleophilia bacterium]|nr:helix-turn-helix transcriptional regulator [Thermoleophilia bacterium]